MMVEVWQQRELVLKTSKSVSLVHCSYIYLEMSYDIQSIYILCNDQRNWYVYYLNIYPFPWVENIQDLFIVILKCKIVCQQYLSFSDRVC